MNKLLKYALFGIGGLVLLLAIVIAVVAATFNPNDYKPLVVKLVKEKKQRTLNIEGDIKLAFYPRIGANLGKISLSEHNGDKEFAAIDGLKVSLALLPLLKKQLVVDTVYVNGVRANIVRYKDGTTNFDDLLSKEEPSQIKFDIDGVKVTNSALSFTDEKADSKYSISKLNVTTGHVALAQPLDVTTDFTIAATNPKLDAAIKLKGNFLFDPLAKHFIAKGLDANVKGNFAGGSDVEVKLSGDLDAKPETNELLVDSLKLALTGTFSGAKLAVDVAAPRLNVQKDEVSGKEVQLSLSQEKGPDHFQTKMVMADIRGSPKAIQSSGISGELSGRQGARTIAGKFSSPFSANLQTMVFDLPKLAGNLDIKDPALPNGSMQGAFALKTHADIKQEHVVSDFNLNIDATQLNGDVNVAGFSKPNIKFNLTANQLDLNKLLGKPSAPEPKSATGKPADLSSLKNLLLEGKVNIGSMAYDKYRIANLLLGIKADGEKLSVNPLSLKLDDTQIKGSLGISHFARPLYTFDLDMDQINADRYVSQSPANDSKPKNDKPLDLTALKVLNADGSLRIGSLKFGKIQSSNIRIDLKADGEKLKIDPLALKLDDTQINGNLGIARFDRPIYSFDLNIDKLDANRYLTKDAAASQPKSDTAPKNIPLDLSALKTLFANGSLKIGSLKYGAVQISGLHADLNADGEKFRLDPLAAKVDDSQIQANLGITRFADPIYSFNVTIDKLDADRYITKSDKPAAKSTADTPIDLSPLKKLNASGEAKIGWLKLANVKTSNVHVGVKAEGGIAQIAPFSADLYQGSMAGNLKVDARSTPSIAFKQEMKGIAVGPLLVDAINNDMLDGKGNLNLDVTTQGASVGALKKGLNGTAALNLADGAIKGIDIAGTIRGVKDKLNVLKSQTSVESDKTKKTDFSEMKASFVIKNGVAHNDDLTMKAPLFRITGSGDIDIANETINYVAKPTVVASLKGQGGADLDALNGLTIPVKVTGTFSSPKYAMDFAAVGTALAKSQLLDKVGGGKAAPLQQLVGGDKESALKSLVGGKSKPAATPEAAPSAAPAPTPAPVQPGEPVPQAAPEAAPAPAPAPAPEPKKALTPEEKAKKKLNKLLGF
jgi:AsmA protein